MKFSHKSTGLFTLFALLGLFFINSSFTLKDTTPAEKTFVVSENGKTISSEQKQKLLKAYKAIYGKGAKIKAIQLVKHKGKMWVALQSGGQASPTLAIQLKMDDKKLIFTNSAVTNTCTGDGCSSCEFTSTSGCVCNAGGGICNHTQTSLKGVASKEPMQILGF